jgi:hypothetical protein
MTTIKLSSPVAHGALTISEITLRKPKVKDLAAADKARTAGDGELAGTIAMIASMTSLPIAVIEEIELDDFTRIAEALGGVVPKEGSPLPSGE